MHALLIATTLLAAGPAVYGADEDILEAGSAWRFLDDGSDQGDAWRAPGFDDSGWAGGPAQLGYGDGDEATVVSYGGNSSNKHITTYFRRTIDVADPSAFRAIEFGVVRDDGVVVYVNGEEIIRSNMPDGEINYRTRASSAVSGAGESAFNPFSFGPGVLQPGENTVAVEIHQSGPTSSDISFDMRVIGIDGPPSLRRGPYLQGATSTSAVVRWRTNYPSDAVVRFGSSPDDLDRVVTGADDIMDHEIEISDLEPATTYFYAIESGGELLAGGDEHHFFSTSPLPGGSAPFRAWVIGDSGTADANARAVRDAYLAHADGAPTDVWLMLGDNAYNDGTDAEYQAAVFETYPTILRNTFLWSTLGNHDGRSADSSDESGVYYDIFTLPRGGEAGGLPSGTEAYYSFDYGNVHFVCLDSYESDRSPDGPMLTWMQADLDATTQDWIVAFWHHPPYSKGSHNSDREAELRQMRTNALPILEAAGVDLVLSGHSHSYERSFLIDGHYGTSSTLDPTMVVDAGDGDPAGDGAYEKDYNRERDHKGAVYAVAGSSGKKSGGPLDHPAMYVSLNELGSMVLDFDGRRLEAVFLDETGAIMDSFVITHEPCLGDFDGNGVLDQQDVSAFVAAWLAGGSEADFDNNLAVDTRDIIAFLGEWLEGC